jgi:hypothetical protein
MVILDSGMLYIIQSTIGSSLRQSLLSQMYYQNYHQYSAVQTAVRLVPMFFSGIACNVFFALTAARVPLVWLVCPYIDTLFLFQSSPKGSGVGTLSTSAAVLLFNLSKPSMSYWPLEFPAIWLSVLGVDLVFSAGSLFIAKFALSHEQSMAGALFTTMIQVTFFLTTSDNRQSINEYLFFFSQKKLGISFGITVTTVVFDKVALATPTGADMIASYHYATWTSGAFGLIGIY